MHLRVVLVIIICSLQIQNVLHYRLQRNLKSSDKSYEEVVRIKECSGLSYLSTIGNKCKPCKKGLGFDEFKHSNTNNCRGCLMHYKIDTLLFMRTGRCKKCPNNKISALVSGHNSTYCSIDNNFKQNKVILGGREVHCSDVVLGSVERDHNTLPYFMYCKCPKDLPRVFSENEKHKMLCLSENELKEIIDSKGLDYIFINRVEIKNKQFYYINCDPNRDPDLIDERCLCPPGYIYHNLKCISCPLTESNAHNIQSINVKCKSNQVLSLDCKTCFCAGNLVLQDGLCKPCKGKKIKSTDGNRCICPKADYPFTENCDKCSKTELETKKCYCHENMQLKDGLCVDQNKRIFDLNHEKNNFPPKYCAPGKFITEDKSCINCPKGSFSVSFNSKKCTKCSYFKTTENFGSESELKYNVRKINFGKESIVVNNSPQQDYENFEIAISNMCLLKNKSKKFEAESALYLDQKQINKPLIKTVSFDEQSVGNNKREMSAENLEVDHSEPIYE
ncbi:MAG: calcium ion binding [Paramarteilia canceri]